MTAAPRSQWARQAEFVLAIGIVVAFYDLVRIFTITGYLPAPFVFNVSDTFMDWFHTAYWSNNRGAYPVWNTVYAPLSFVITWIFSDHRCYTTSAFDGRDCDNIGKVFIVASYLAGAALSARAFWRNDRSTAVPRSVAVLFGGPLLFALERGNTMLQTYVVFVLLFGVFASSRYLLALFAGLLINLKLYFLFPIVGLAIKREWRMLELCGLATLGVYLLSLAFVGDGTPGEIYSNLKVWFDLRSNVAWDELLYSTTYSPWLIFDERQYPIRDFVGSLMVETITRTLVVEIAISRALCLACILGAWLYPKAVSYPRVAFFILMESFIRTNPGGYGIGVIVFFIFLEPWTNWRVGAAIVMAYLVSLPTDKNVSIFYHFVREAWLSQREVDSTYALSWGALLRPGLMFLILWAIAADTLINVHRAMRSGRPEFGFGRPRDLGPFASAQARPLPAS